MRISQRGCVSPNEGLELSRKIGAARYVECSAKNNTKVTEAISEAIRAAIQGPAEDPARAARVAREERKVPAAEKECCCSIV